MINLKLLLKMKKEKKLQYSEDYTKIQEKNSNKYKLLFH